MELKEFTVGDLMSKSYIISKNSNALIIDPGAEGQKLYHYLQKNNLELKYIINTHGHFDHIAANQFLKEKTNAKILGHPKINRKLKDPKLNLSQLFMGQNICSPSIDQILNDGELFLFENLELKIIYTPGHSEDGISIYIAEEQILFSGDCIFSSGIGRTDLNDSDFQQLVNSIEDKIFSLPVDTVFYPGHGPKGIISSFKNKVWPAVK